MIAQMTYVVCRDVRDCLPSASLRNPSLLGSMILGGQEMREMTMMFSNGNYGDLSFRKGLPVVALQYVKRRPVLHARYGAFVIVFSNCMHS
jgi:hypothetical protein